MKNFSLEKFLKLLNYITLLLLLLLSFFILQCSKDEIRDNNSINDNHSGEENPLFSERFRKVGWINSNRYRAVVHIQTYEQCIKNRPEYLREYLEARALRNIQNELDTGLSRSAAIQITILIKNNGIIMRPDLQCKEINIYYFDIAKENLLKDFQNIRTLK
jgi:hypothetical protein